MMVASQRAYKNSTVHLDGVTKTRGERIPYLTEPVILLYHPLSHLTAFPGLLVRHTGMQKISFIVHQQGHWLLPVRPAARS